MEIDWSKAPEGTTHKETKWGADGFWYKFDFKNDTAAYCPPDESWWTVSGKASEYNDGSMDHMTARPIQTEDARESAIKDLMQIDDVYYQQAADIYDRGYRKFEITDES